MVTSRRHPQTAISTVWWTPARRPARLRRCRWQSPRAAAAAAAASPSPCPFHHGNYSYFGCKVCIVQWNREGRCALVVVTPVLACFRVLL